MGSRVHIRGKQAREQLAESRNKFPSRPGGGGTSVLLAPGIPSVPIGPPVDPSGGHVCASINVLETLKPLERGKAQDIPFAYVCGNPLATRFGIQWFATLEGALAMDEATLLDPVYLPFVEFFPVYPEFRIPDTDSVENPLGTLADVPLYAGRSQVGRLRITGQSDGAYRFKDAKQQDGYPVLTIYQPGVNIDV